MESSNVNIRQSRAKNQEDVPLKNVRFSVRRKNKNLNLKVDLPVIICQFTNILLENQMRIFKDTWCLSSYSHATYHVESSLDSKNDFVFQLGPPLKDAHLGAQLQSTSNRKRTQSLYLIANAHGRPLDSKSIEPQRDLVLTQANGVTPPSLPIPPSSEPLLNEDMNEEGLEDGAEENIENGSESEFEEELYLEPYLHDWVLFTQFAFNSLSFLISIFIWNC